MPRRAELSNLAPARLDITHYRGDTLPMRFRLRSQGVPVDIRGWDFQAQIRSVADGPITSEFYIFGDEIYPDGSGSFHQDGIVRMVLTEMASQTLQPVSSWDFQVKETVQQVTHVRTLLRGFIYASADITHSGISSVSLSGRR